MKEENSCTELLAIHTPESKMRVNQHSSVVHQNYLCTFVYFLPIILVKVFEYILLQYLMEQEEVINLGRTDLRDELRTSGATKCNRFFMSLLSEKQLLQLCQAFLFTSRTVSAS